MMRILVTGNLGYVGAVLGSHLSSSYPKWDFLGYDAGFFESNFPASAMVSGYSRQERGDVRDLKVADLEGIHAIIHLAAISNDPMGRQFEVATKAINTDAAIATARAARQAGVCHFIFASSCSMYGKADNFPCNEQARLDPQTAYAVSKVEAERGLADLVTDEFSVTCLRFATACGSSPRMRLDLVLNDFVASAVQFGKIEVLSDGSPWRPLIHTKDMARAIEWALIRDQGGLLTLNVGSTAWSWQIGNLATNVAEVLRGVSVNISSTAPADGRSYKVDFSQFGHMAPDHQPTADFGYSVSELRDQIAGLPLDGQSFRTSRLIRLNELRRQASAGMLDGSLRCRSPNT